MIRLANMLMIGSAGANVGKTELACAILAKLAGKRDIVGIKVTTIRDRDGQCPRGGQGCGACGTLEGDFSISRETDRDSQKDTARLLAAGAAEVFWLRIMDSCLEEGLARLLSTIGRDRPWLCESNSLRHVVEPGLFLMTRGKGKAAWKDSALQVRPLADRIVTSDGHGFDLELDQVCFEDGRWALRGQGLAGGTHLGRLAETTAIIMAGGNSGRMGADKSMLEVDGRPMIERLGAQLRGYFDQVIVSTNDAAKLRFLGLEVVPDRLPGQGPLMGMASALGASANDLNFVVACDIPNVDLRYVRKIVDWTASSGADAVVPTTGPGKHEPLFAVYRKSALAAMNKALSSGARKILDISPFCRLEYVDLGRADWLVNLNTPRQYEDFRNKHGDQFQEGF